MNLAKSVRYMEKARKLIPGGVNSPVRSFRGMECPPPVIHKARGAYVEDLDGNTYLDYVLSWGPMILGHCDLDVVAAIKDQASFGLSFGAPCEAELELASFLVDHLEALEMIRMVNSGTEATMSAIRLARGFTGRTRILKFDGCYHGHADSLLVKAGSGAMTFGQPDSLGVPGDFAKHTLTAEFNSLESVEALFREYKKEIACVIVEPVPGNMGMVLPLPEFLPGLRRICDQNGALLIFDEVMSGFRVGFGGAVSHYSVQPDLLCLGKVIGGGLPVGAYGGKREIMSTISPIGGVYQAGTLSGNPLAMRSGLATLKKLKAVDPWNQFAKTGEYLQKEFERIAAAHGIEIVFHHLGSMFTLFFHKGPIYSKADVDHCDLLRFRRFFAAMIEEGIYLAPSQYEAGFLSVMHLEPEIEKTICAFSNALKKM